MRGYRELLALPGIRGVLLVTFLAKVPGTAAAITLTLHVAVSLERGYGAAGLVATAATVGMGVGSPLMGRVVDRYGLRRMLAVTVTGESVFWLTAGLLPFPLLLAGALAGGLLTVPKMSVSRQVIAAMVPPGRLRRAGYSVDSISTELTFMLGPTLAVLVATQVSTTVTMLSLSATTALTGITLYLVNPPVRSAEESAEPAAPRPRLSEWLTPRLLGVYVAASGGIFVMAGMEVAVIAELRSYGQVDWAGIVIAAGCVASVTGGLVYGALHRPVSQPVLLLLLGVLCVPAGLAGTQWWLLALALTPMSLLIAPTLAVTGERVAELAPVPVRGVANGLQASAFTAGAALGAPVAGFVIDHNAAAWGFAAAGAGGMLLGGLAMLLAAGRHRPAEPAADRLTPGRPRPGPPGR